MSLLPLLKVKFCEANQLLFYCPRIGEKVPFAKKGKFGVVHGSIQEWFNPYHLFVETSSKDDFSLDKITQQVAVLSLTLSLLEATFGVC